MFRKHSPLRIVLITISAVGIACTLYYNEERNQLRGTLTELQKQVGVWKVEDESKVVIARIPVAKDAIPPGVGKCHLWQYRIHLPAKYAPCVSSTSGLVKANAPGGQGSQNTGMSGQIAEPEQKLATVALIETDDQWKFYFRVGGNSSSASMPPDFSIERLGDFVVEPVVSGNEIGVFDADEAICLFRIREKELATDGRGNIIKDLYAGCTAYIFSKDQQDAFTEWSQGQRNSMKETLQ
ncbi:MAG: hypothetical protein GY904_04360 [Planctomycetaceae bacterium]|nr:hypothetical protein [Planctomycetaceae bacterium]